MVGWHIPKSTAPHLNKLGILQMLLPVRLALNRYHFINSSSHCIPSTILYHLFASSFVFWVGIQCFHLSVFFVFRVARNVI